MGEFRAAKTGVKMKNVEQKLEMAYSSTIHRHSSDHCQ